MSDTANILHMENFQDNLISNLQGGVILCQFDPVSGKSKTLYLSEGWTALTGYTLADLNSTFGGNPQSLVIAEDVEQATKSYVKQLTCGNSYQLEYRFSHKDGHLVWVIDRGIVTQTVEGFNLNQSIITDITPLKKKEEELALSDARFRIATRASNATVFEFDLASMSFLHIENAEVIFRMSAQAVIKRAETMKNNKVSCTLDDVQHVWYHPEDAPTLQQAHQLMLQNGSSECEVRIRQPNNSYIWCKRQCAVVFNHYGEPMRIIGHLVNVDEQHKQTERLRLEAQSDALTGLYNKGAIQELIEETLSATPHLQHCLLVLDIDNFKGVNDKLGHLFGDAVLLDVSSKLKRLFRRDGLVGRIGGDEFVILIQGGVSPDDAAVRAEEICRLFRHTYSGEKADYKVSCSVGVALSCPEDTYDSLFSKADVALYQAKEQGKDRFQLYSGNNTSVSAVRVHNPEEDSGRLKIKERIFELLYGSYDFSGSINMILTLLGQLLEVDRVYISETSSDQRFAYNLYEWCAEGVASNMQNMQNLPIGELSYFYQFDTNGIFRCRDTSVLPPALRKVYQASGISSTFQVAILEEGVFRGFMGYDSLSRPISQTSEQIDTMIFSAKVIGTFILKKRADESIKQHNQNKVAALDNLPCCIYVIDEQYRIHYMNNLIYTYFPHARKQAFCYELFMQNEAPCPNCPALSCQDGPCNAEIYNAAVNLRVLSSASAIRWSGQDNMRLICCQIISDHSWQ